MFASPVIPGPDILTVSFDHWEGPLDLLLTLARGQKVLSLIHI